MGVINSLAVDKVLHALFSLLICIAAACVFSAFGLGHDAIIYASLVTALLIGGLKEVADLVWGMGTPSWDDFLADFIGVTLALLFISILIA